jgi:hypothetical protein
LDRILPGARSLDPFRLNPNAFELFAGVVREDELVNTLKPLLIVAVLAGIGYGVYVRINNGSDAPPPGAPEGWDAQPQVQLPGGTAPSGSAPWVASVAPANPSVAPPFGGQHNLPPGAGPSHAGEAPPYNPTPPVGALAPNNPPPGAGNAPPYAPGGPNAPPFNDPRASVPPIPPEPAIPEPTRGDEYRDLPPRDSVGAAQPQGSAPAPAGGSGYDTGAGGPLRAPAGGAPSRFTAAMETVRRELEGGQMSSALRQLSNWYEDPQLSLPERQQLNQLLDQIAGTVIYSTQHLLESPYEVQQGERLEDIGQRYNVPWQLLAKINGVDDPQSLRSGERLKVMRGPFSAVISLEKRQLTLLLGDGSYAGRFAVGIGRENPPQEGVYAVSDKVVNPVYRGREQTIGAGDATNPLGDRWIGLGTNLGIHGTNRPDTIGRTDLPGSISLNPRDVEDVYDILSVGSKVTIRR